MNNLSSLSNMTKLNFVLGSTALLLGGYVLYPRHRTMAHEWRTFKDKMTKDSSEEDVKLSEIKEVITKQNDKMLQAITEIKEYAQKHQQH